MDEAAYEKLRECVFTSDINVCDDVPSGAGRAGGAKLTDPLGGTAHQVDGADRYIRVCGSHCNLTVMQSFPTSQMPSKTSMSIANT